MRLLNRYFFSKKLDILAFTTFIPIIGLFLALSFFGFKFPENVPFEFLLLGITLVDGTHVYSTLFVTYLDAEMIGRQKFTMLAIPIAVFFLIAGSSYFGYREYFLVFMGHMGAFHFVRQEYGFMTIASRFDAAQPKWVSIFDKATSYTMTIAPLLWFMRESGPRSWFTEGDLTVCPDWLAEGALALYWPMICGFLLVNGHHTYKTKTFNLSKMLVFVNTFFGWYVAKTMVDNVYLAIWLTIFHHGIPYMFIVFKTERVTEKVSWLRRLGAGRYALMYVLCAAVTLAVVGTKNIPEVIAFLKKPALLSATVLGITGTPLLAHFVVDAFIWKRKQKLVKSVEQEVQLSA